MAEKKTDLVLYEREGNIARITLNRPEKLNAFDFPGQGGLLDHTFAALDKASQDDDVKVIIIRANGRAFSAGHDLTTVGFVYGMGTGKDDRRASERVRLHVDRHWLVDHHMTKLFLNPKLTIAQVHGFCIGEGILILSCCDMAIAAEDAQIGHSEQRLGFAGSGVGTIPILFMTVGLKRGMDLLLTGRQISGKEAERIGLVNKSVPADKLEEETNRVAKALSLLPRDGIAIGKAARHEIYESMGLTAGFTTGYWSHTLFTNLRWEADEYNFFRERRNKGVKEGFHARDERFSGLV